jgi:hypothetical protein
MIHADAKCRDVIISDNIFNAKGKSVVIEAGARDIHAHDNRCSNPLTQPPPR